MLSRQCNVDVGVISMFIWFQVDIHFNKDRNLTYSVSYVPRLEGNHKVAIKFAGREIPKSPYTVSVEGHAGDPSKVTASGPGLQPDGMMINRPTYFDISTKGM
jgi:filamin